MNASTSLENQLLVTKFYVPVALSPLISRPRLTSLLNESMKYSLTLVSASAGFGKTTLLASWSQSLPASNPWVAWVSLDEEDNDPQLFWTYVLTALDRQRPHYFASLLTQLQSQQSPPLTYLLAELINLLTETTDHFLLILDDYQVITEQQVHTTLSYLVEHLPPQLHIILSTRTDPPLPLSQLRARRQMQEIRTQQLRCTGEETREFLHRVMGSQLAEKTIQEVTARTEGWLVCLQLLALSLPSHVNPTSLLEEISGDHRYILDYLTEEVLCRQPQEVQTFLLCTSILEERLTASLCDAVMEQAGSQQMLQRLEQANLFLVSLDSTRQWYRYHTLFTEALYYRLKQVHGDLVPLLHLRASRWYAEHNQITEAILHALRAQEWQWAAELIERRSFSLLAHTWGASNYAFDLLQQWLALLPMEVMHSRPSLCYASAMLLLQTVSSSVVHGWIDAAEAILTVSPARPSDEATLPPILTPQMQKEQENLLAGLIGIRAVLRGLEGDGENALVLSKQVLALATADNLLLRSQTLLGQTVAFYNSSVNDAQAGLEIGLQSISLAQDAGVPSLTIMIKGIVALCMLASGQLHGIWQLTQQAILLGKQPGETVLSIVGLPACIQVEILREWNKMDEALSLAEEALALCNQIPSMNSLSYLLFGYAVQLRVHLSLGNLDRAYSLFQQLETVGIRLNELYCTHTYSYFTIIDQVRLWLACGELDRATRWVEDLDKKERHSNPFVYEREEVAYVRILLAKQQPASALERLEPVLQRAIAGQRWGHVIEMRLLQALAYQMLKQEMVALSVLTEAVRLGESEGYIRSFVDEGTPMESLLYRLRRRNRKHGPTPYLDTLLAVFQQKTKLHAQTEAPAQLPEPLSEREREVLQLLARGTSNQEIAQELVIAVDTVKRHTSHIFSKLGVHNRMQAVRQAQELDLLSEEM